MTKSETKRKSVQKTGNLPKIKKKTKDYIEIKVGTETLKLPKALLELHRGVDKAVMNHVLPFVTKVLNEKD